MNGIKFLVLCFLSLSIQATQPLPESLFRNGINDDLKFPAVKVQMYIQQESMQINAEVSSQRWEVLAYFLKESDSRVRAHYLLVTPDGKIFRKISIPSLSQYASDRSSSSSQRVFQSLWSYLFTNDSRAMSNYLKSQYSRYSSNIDLINREKLNLLERQKDFLRKKANKIEGHEELKSPLQGETEEEKKKIKEILDSPFYNSSELVRMEKINDKYFWNLELDDFVAQFYNESRRIKLLRFKSGEGYFALEFFNFNKIKGFQILPEQIFVLSDSNETWKIEITDFANYNWDLAEYNKRMRSIDVEPINPTYPSFLMSIFPL